MNGFMGVGSPPRFPYFMPPLDKCVLDHSALIEERLVCNLQLLVLYYYLLLYILSFTALSSL